jgi:translation initiation factor IF-3
MLNIDTVRIGDHDLEIKINRAKDFLEEGNKVQFTLRFKGREMAHTDLGRNLLNRVKTELWQVSKVERDAKMEGRRMTLLLQPDKKAPGAKPPAPGQAAAPAPRPPMPGPGAPRPAAPLTAGSGLNIQRPAAGPAGAPAAAPPASAPAAAPGVGARPPANPTPAAPPSPRATPAPVPQPTGANR